MCGYHPLVIATDGRKCEMAGWACLATCCPAALPVACHGTDRAVSGAFVAGWGLLGVERSGKYYEYGHDMSSRVVRKILEAIVATTRWPVCSPIAKEHFGGGKEHFGRGKAEATGNLALMALKARAVQPAADECRRLSDCTDPDQLTAWAEAALTAASTAGVFGQAAGG